MNVLQRAGRHGSYMTQFWRRGRRYGTPLDSRTAHSRKAIERRLVLPLDTHNWLRALEVLGAGYARLGRTAAHYQRVIRDMIDHPTALSSAAAPVPMARRGELAGVLDTLRAQAYAEEIPVSASLWVTLLWAYCRIEQPQRALECYTEARRRFTFSPATLRHMERELLLPQLCRGGLYHEARALLEQKGTTTALRDGTTREGLRVSDDRGSGSGSSPGVQDARLRRGLAEAAARAGEWRSALRLLQQGTAPGQTCQAQSTARDQADGETRSCTLDALFRDATSSLQAPSSHDAVAAASTTSHPSSPARPHTRFAGLSTAAQQQMLQALCLAGAWQEAIECWGALYGDATGDKDAHRTPPPAPSPAEVRLFLNCLCQAGAFDDVLRVFRALYLPPRRGGEDEVHGGAVVAPTALPLDATVLNLVFTAFPTEPCEVSAAGPSRQQGRQLLPPCRVVQPEKMIALFDELLQRRDDMQVTDYVMAAVGPALLQGGAWQRVLGLLRQTPMLSPRGARRVPAHVSDAHRALKERLVMMVYYIHSRSDWREGATTAQEASMRAFPQLFPPEVIRRLAHADAAKAATDTTALPSECTVSDEEWLARRPARPATSLRPSRQDYLPVRSSTLLTELQERAMRTNFAFLHSHRDEAFCEGVSPDADPRPIPKGLHDTASGWNYVGRAGEMVFANSRRTPHPFSMQPKVMRALNNPYRGWNPRQNSSLAHRENVIKWNPRSAM